MTRIEVGDPDRSDSDRRRQRDPDRKAKRPGWEETQGPGCEVEDSDKRRREKRPRKEMTRMSDLEGK